MHLQFGHVHLQFPALQPQLQIPPEQEHISQQLQIQLFFTHFVLVEHPVKRNMVIPQTIINKIVFI